MRRQVVKRAILLKQLGGNPACDNELTIPGEPMVYSVKYSLENRQNTANYLRNKQYNQIIKCLVASVMNEKRGCVVLVKFFVSPPGFIDVSPEALKKERTPAVQSFECIDYALSFLEMLQKVVFKNYRQIVKIDIEKWYSDNPRTVFKYITWDDYVKDKNNHPVYPKSKGFREADEERLLQSYSERYAKDLPVRQAAARRARAAIAERCAARDRALQDPGVEGSQTADED